MNKNIKLIIVFSIFTLLLISPIHKNVSVEHMKQKEISLEVFGDAENWWDSDWTYKRNITLSAPDSNLNEFPVYIHLDDTTHMTEDSLRFVANYNEVLAHEIEDYDTNDVHAFVKVNLTSGGNNYIEVYYGNDEAENGEDATNVWDSHYLAVWHLDNAEGSVAVDSTGNDENMTEYDDDSEVQEETTGIIHYGMTFAGKTSYGDGAGYQMDTDFNAGDTDDGTYEAWATLESDVDGGDDRKLFSNKMNLDYRWTILFDDGEDDMIGNCKSGGSNRDVYYSLGNSGFGWTYLVLAGEDEGGDLDAWVNDSIVDTVEMTGTHTGGAEDFAVGMESYTDKHGWDGKIDEVRVSDIKRSDDWIEYTYNNIANQDTYITIGSEEEQVSDDWADWDYSRQITINHNMIDSDLINFPVLINISSDGGLASYAQDDGDDIAFADESNTTQYHHEIEYFDGDTGRLVVWVNITSLSSSADTIINMHYGNSEASNQENKTGTWNTGFSGVYHFNQTDIDGDSGDIKDSTAYDKDGTSYNMDTDDQVESAVDGGFDFDGSNDYVDFEINAITTAVTITMWVKMPGDHEWDGLIAATASYIECFMRLTTSDTLQVFFNDNAATSSDISSCYDGDWHLLGMTYDGSNLKGWVDGVNNGDTGLASKSINQAAFDVGKYSTGQYYNGGIDEVRMSSIARNASWIKTEYNNVRNATNGGFYSFEGIQADLDITLSDENPANETRSVDLTKQCSITVSEPDSYDMNVTFATNESGEWVNKQTNSSVGDGTYYWTFTDCDENYTTYYWRVYVDNGHGENVSETYYFKTLLPFTVHIIDNDLDSAYAVKIEDIDDDGNNDIVAVGYNSNANHNSSEHEYGNLRWYKNDGNYNFNVYYNISEWNYGGVRLDIADFNDDTYSDIVVADYGNDAIYVYNHSGDPTDVPWTRTSIKTSWVTSYTVEVADFDNDDDYDIVGTAPGSSNGVGWANNTGDLNFSWCTIYDAGSPHGSCVGDFDDDDWIDVAVSEGSSNKNIHVYENDGTPANDAWSRNLVYNPTYSALGFNAIDMDNDSDLDIVSSSNDDGDIAWYENDGTPFSGTWTKHVVDADFDRARDAYGADIDDDGDTDVIGASDNVLSSLDCSFSWWENLDGDGTSWYKYDMNVSFLGTDSTCYAYANDIDDDGDLDIFTASSKSGSDCIVWYESHLYEPAGNSLPELTNPEGEPDNAVASYTTIYFNITWADADGEDPSDGYLKVNASKTGWSTNQSMSYLSGDNTTGAIYQYTTTLTAGEYEYTFYAYDGTDYNSSGSHSGLTVVSQSLSFNIVTSSDGNLDFKDWSLSLTGVGKTTEYNVSEDNQTADIPALNISNTGNVPLNFTMNWSGDPGTGISMKYNTTDNEPKYGENQIATTPSTTQIISNLATSTYEQIWLWMDFNDVEAQSDSEKVSITSSKYGG